MKTQDPKFTIEDNRLHGQSGIVPDDEPLFIMRARDENALAALYAYEEECVEAGVDKDHLKAIHRRIEDFNDFVNLHPERMKQPDTNLAQLHDAKL